jgi:hypothetical protein
MTQEHVSTFELDVYFASPGEDAPEIAEHVASCTKCAAYLETLAVLDGDAVRLAVPAAVAPAAPATAPSPARRPSARLGRFVAPASAVLALAAAVAIYVRSRPSVDDSTYVGVKGAPAVQVLVRSGTQTRVWDGRSAVHAGDAVALHIACEQLEHVTVVTEANATLVRLWDGPCAKPPAPLPFTLVVDDQPGRERFAVVLGRSRLEEPALREAVRASTRSSDVWVTAIELPKEIRR